MLSEEKILILSQLILAEKEAILSLEKAISLKDNNKIELLKHNLLKLNEEIAKNIAQK